jgi:acetyltransferase-like isoleucine patch superfamily enzyme
MDSLKIMTCDKPFIIKDNLMPKDIQKKARVLCYKYNNTDPSNFNLRQEILKELIPNKSDLTFIEQGFKCDYGMNIYTHGLCVINFNCTILDTSKVEIGKNCFIAPNVVIACSSHPIDPIDRSNGYLVSKPITIKDNVWIGANSTICQGVTIGTNSVIGAGSVVVKDIPCNVVAVGNPCKVLRPICKEDKIEFNEKLKEYLINEK